QNLYTTELTHLKIPENPTPMMSAPQSPQSPPRAHRQSTPWSQVSLIADTPSPSPSPPSAQPPISTEPTGIRSQVENPEQFNLAAFLSQEGLFLPSRSPNIDVDDVDEYDEEAGLFCEDDYLMDPEPKPEPEPEPEPQPEQEEAVEEFTLPPLDGHTGTHKELIDTLN
ncbi:hypothetical protein FQN50_010045, partial [Emmonsiellopsis sp. PD_5]